MKMKGIPVWVASGAILGISCLAYLLTGLELAIATVIFLAAFYFLPLDNGLKAGNAEAKEVAQYRARRLGHSKYDAPADRRDSNDDHEENSPDSMP